jgi:hypothetical protein
MDEMRRRGYKPDSNWYKYNWRGSTLGEQEWCDRNDCFRLWENAQEGAMIYPEHNDEYFRECLDNLKGKGIEIEITPIGNQSYRGFLNLRPDDLKARGGLATRPDDRVAAIKFPYYYRFLLNQWLFECLNSMRSLSMIYLF